LRLFRLEHGEQVRFLKRGIRLERNLELSWFLNYRDYADDLLDRAILEALGDVWELRDALAYGIAAEGARQELGCMLDEKLKALHTLYKADALITGLFPKVKSASRCCYDDVKSQHDFLFRPHFLRSGMFFEHYSRYLRGLKLRVERLTASPGKDELKMEQLEEYTERFSLAVEGVEISEHPALEEFWHLLEEARLSVFAPEVPLAVRTPLKKLPDAWNNLRI
jgi:ATP-dependent helicase HrpA